MSLSNNTKIDIYRSVHKALRSSLFHVSQKIGKFDTECDSNLNEIKVDFEELSGFLKDHGNHEDNCFHNLIENKHPEVFFSLQDQHEKAESDWHELEGTAQKLFELEHKIDFADWHRFYLKFNQFLVSYLSHLQYEELVALPALWDATSDEDIMRGLAKMFKHFTPEALARSKKWCLPSCTISELKAMRYIA